MPTRPRRQHRPAAAVALAGALAVVLPACAGSDDRTAPTAAPATTATAVPATTVTGAGGPTGTTGALPARARVEVVARFPHDTAAFTEGLVDGGDGTVLESTGLYGASDVRRVDLATGQVGRRVPLADDQFGEGLARRPDGSLVQLTWKEHTALVRDPVTLAETGRFTYEGEGWGLCGDGRRLVMSDGSSRLTFRDPATFAVTGTVPVTRGGQPVDQLNELECADGLVYANVWQTDQIVVIDPTTGRVTTTVDASGLLTDAERAGADVLNGIVAEPGGTLLVTGKRWPAVFRVRLVPA